MHSLLRRVSLLATAFVSILFPIAAYAQTNSGATPAPPAQSSPATTDAPQQQQATPDLPDSPGTATQVHTPVTPTGPTAVIDTSMGRLTCKLYQQQAPVTVANFIGLAEGTKDWTDPTTQKKQHSVRYYDGTTFHRVIPNFMIQGGDRVGNGTGDPGYMFQDEFDPTLAFDVPGRLAMANSGPGTNGSQFFITEVPVEQLNGKHTIFGQCDAHSILLVSSIARVSRDGDDKPETPVVIQKVTIVREGQPIPAAPPTPALIPPPAPPAPAAGAANPPQ